MTNSLAKRRLRILVTGDYRQCEFSDRLQSLVTEYRDHDFQFTDLDQAVAAELEPDIPYDVVLVAQSRRNQFSQSQIDELCRLNPLAARVIIVGSWCEGETRSGVPLNGMHRIFIRDWDAEYASLLQAIIETGTSRLSRPATETIADRLMDDDSAIEQTGPLNVAVHACSRELFGAVQEFCSARGWTAKRVESADKCDVAIVECYYSIDEAIQVVTDHPLLKNKPFVAICGFPRDHDRETLATLKQPSQVLGKPFDNNLLDSAIKRLVSNGKLNVIGNVA